MSRYAVVKVRVTDGARDQEWLSQKVRLEQLGMTYCDECLTTQPEGEWISVGLIRYVDHFCSWECLLIEVAGICLETEYDHPQIKVKYPKVKP